MNKRSVIIVASFVLAIIALFVVRTQTTKRAAVVEHADRSPEQASAAPTVATTGGEKETRSREGNAHPFCAPGSTLYLTQAQQEYRLGERGPNTPDVKDAKRNGALAKVTLRVVDSRGNPVPDADVKVAFFHRGPYSVDGKTDKNGFFTAKHMSESDVHFHASKEGYYRTYRNYWFYREGKPCAKDGRWIPWNPTLEVIMKEKRNPVALDYKTVESRVPVYDEPLGFDLVENDWVVPHGKGVRSDMVLTYSEKDEALGAGRYTLSLGFPDIGNGVYVRQTDRYSQLLSDYVAANDGYSTVLNFIYERTKDKIVSDVRIDESKMLVFRIRSQIDGDGNIRSAQYGKIYGPFKFADGPRRFIRFSYYLNPVVNDPNIEAKGQWP